MRSLTDTFCSNGQYQPTYPPYHNTNPPEYGEEYGEEYRDEGNSAVDHDRSRRNGGGYQNPPPRTPAQGPAGQAYYFPADQTYAQQPVRYDNNLAFDDDQNGTSENSGYTGQTTQSGYTSQTTHYNSDYYPQKTSGQGHYNTYVNGHGHAQHSETTRRWSTEISPEERLRLGLPRYESEEQRLAYENAGVQYDQQQQYDNNTQQ
jgi:hypothetical protein